MSPSAWTSYCEEQMQTGTLPGMGRKKAPPKLPTGLVRLRQDLVDMLGSIAHERKKDIADILDPVVRPFVSREYAEVVEEMRRKAKKQLREGEHP
jgi:hypothetical protein